jgi:hypothetical protein
MYGKIIAERKRDGECVVSNIVGTNLSPGYMAFVAVRIGSA